jgi:hypothetical protein
VGLSFKKKSGGGGDSGTKPKIGSQRAPKSKPPTDQDLLGNSTIAQSVTKPEDEISPLLMPPLPEVPSKGPPNKPPPPLPMMGAPKQGVTPAPLEVAPQVLPELESAPKQGVTPQALSTDAPTIAPPRPEAPQVAPKQTVAPERPLTQAPVTAPVEEEPKKKKGLMSRIFGGKKKKEEKPGKDRMKDRHVTSQETLAKGSINEVKKVNYRRGIGNSGQKQGFFKESVKEDRDKGFYLPQEAQQLGMDANDPHMSARAVASSRLDKGLGINVLSEDVFAKHDGKVGVTSAKVEGEAMRGMLYEKDVTGQINRMYGERAPQKIREMQDNQTQRIDKENLTVKNFSGFEFGDVDFKNSEVQKGLSNLQLMDYLTGQVDRHEGNIFVGENGKVTGIDNDMAFGKESAEGVGKNQGMPQLVDAEVGLKILNTSEEEIRAMLTMRKGDMEGLDESEIEAAIRRFDELKAHVDNLYMNDQLIYEWNDETYERAVAGGSGYLARGVNARKNMDDDDKLRQRKSKAI